MNHTKPDFHGKIALSIKDRHALSRLNRRQQGWAKIATLDLVISIDSAAALGRPVWLLLPPIADRRWGLDTRDTPWYPGM